MWFRIVLCVLFCSGAVAGELEDRVIRDDEQVNFCLDKQAELNNEKLAIDHPKDKELVKLVALRAGLCYLVGKKIVDFELAVDLFNAEKQAEILRRLQNEQSEGRESGA